ncbi:DUF4360 domain-containing protein [Pilimelia terevasa]|nr:DUF4360 domain-containing protein [Pilimelia terevasa]
MTTASLVTAGSPPAAAGDPDDILTIESIKTSGTGCPTPDSVTSEIQDHGKVFVVGFYSYEVRAPKAVSTDLAVKTCRLSLKMKQKPGYTYALVSVNFRGGASRGKDARARFVGNYAFTSGTGNPPVVYDDIAPKDDSVAYEWARRQETKEFVWMPCDQAAYLNIQTQLDVRPGLNNTSAWADLSSTDGRFTTLEFRHKQCDK